jgi:CHAD domain-containing protein
MDPETGTDTRTFRVADDAQLPPLDGVTGVARTNGVAREELETTYFDTPDLTLTGAGITLLHSTGDTASWRLQLPAPDGGSSVLQGTGGASEAVPEPLRHAVRLYARDAELAPIGRMRTERQELGLLDESGAAVARVRDERVTASALAPADTGMLLAWREWTVEALDGNSAVADEAGMLLSSAGGTPAGAGPEVTHILGDRAPNPPKAGKQKRLRRRSSAADVVGARLRDQLAELEHWDVLTRWDAPDSVHKLRVATRRLRSALATFRPMLDRTQTDPVRDELKWIAGLLGEARDLEVAQEHIAATIAGEPVELMIGPVGQHADRELSGEQRAARDRAVEAMGTERYFSMVDRLRAVVADPPWAPHAEKRARKLLRARVAADFTRLRKRVAAADAEADTEERAVRLHDVRKAAKRTRYAAEALAPVYGRDAERFAAAAEQVQEVLGEHHDAVTLLPRIRQLGVQAHLDGENAFSYGRLHALQQARIAALNVAYRDAWNAASRKKLRRWLK